MADSAHSAWPEWKAPEWNVALFHHFFEVVGPDVQPVTRLVVTSEELQRATGDAGADPERVQQTFLDVVRLPPRAFRRKLSAAEYLTEAGEWPRSGVPPFVVYLVFTCFVASTIEAEVIREGDFRKRLRILLGHPPETSYSLEGLAALWQAFARWLDRRRKEGAPYRALILPDPGWMVRIGYSIRLAFPPPKDQIRLAQLLQDGGFDGDPPIPAVLHAVGRQIGAFSLQFREAFEKFQRAYEMGEADIDRHAFWSAVRDAIARAPTSLGVNASRAKFQLFMELDAESSAEVVLTASGRTGGHSVRMLRAEQSLAEYPYIIAIDGAEDGPRAAARSLMDGSIQRVLPALRRSPVWIAVQQGVLLFRRNETGLRELATSRPDEGRVWALVRRDLVDAFRSLFPENDRPTPAPSRYPSWFEFPSFDGSLLARLGRQLPPALSSVRCLQPTASRPRIHLSGGVPVAGGYLGLADCLPTVRVAGADTLVLFRVELRPDGAHTVEWGPLQKVPHLENSFEFPRNPGSVLDGRFTLTAWSGGTLIAQRQVNFRSHVIWQDYQRPSDPEQWLVEAAGPDMIPPSTDPIAPEALEEPIRRPAHGGRRGIGPARARELGLPAGSFPERSANFPHLPADPDADDALARFIEISAALAMNKKGIPEPEFLELLGEVLGIDDYGILWDVARAWVEGGYFDCLSRRTWRGRVYFARDPRLVLWRTGITYHAALMGLAPRDVRARVKRIAEANGARVRTTGSSSRWVPALLSWSGSSEELFQRIASESGLQRCRWLIASSEFVSPVADVLSDREPDGNLRGYERRGSWNWGRGRFTPESVINDACVAVEWYDRSDRPPVFLVKRNGKPYWRSYSRNWALLVAYTLARIPPFEKLGSVSLGRRVAGQVYLPLPLSRAIAALAESTPGPAPLDDGSWTYAYSLPAPAQRSHVLRLLWGGVGHTMAVRRARWLAGLIRERKTRPDERTIALPSSFWNAVTECPEFAQVMGSTSRTVPPFVIPHIRMLITEIRR